MDGNKRADETRMLKRHQLRQQIDALTYGFKRRELILQYIKDHCYQGEMHVNRKYCFNLNKDKDLQKMVKTGVLKRHRSPSVGWSRCCRRTYLTIA